MKHVDEELLESDLPYRFAYLAEFMQFTPEDIDAIHGAVEHLKAIVSGLVDAIDEKLLDDDDATKQHFIPRQSVFHGTRCVGDTDDVDKLADRW